MKNCRPVSNESFFSKSLDSAVGLYTVSTSDLQRPESPNGNTHTYRKFHSTETAVTTVNNDLLIAADSVRVSALCLLDLTAAFDTVDRDFLKLRLERQFDLQWFRSYLFGADLLKSSMETACRRLQFSSCDLCPKPLCWTRVGLSCTRRTRSRT